MILFKNFLKIWLIGTVASLVPLLIYGLVFGSPAVLIASLVTTLVFRKELGVKKKSLKKSLKK